MNGPSLFERTTEQTTGTMPLEMRRVGGYEEVLCF